MPKIEIKPDNTIGVGELRRNLAELMRMPYLRFIAVHGKVRKVLIDYDEYVGLTEADHAKIKARTPGIAGNHGIATPPPGKPGKSVVDLFSGIKDIFDGKEEPHAPE